MRNAWKSPHAELPRTRLTLWDGLIAACLLLLAILLLTFPMWGILGGDEVLLLEVRTEEGVTTYSMAQNQEFSIVANQITLRIRIQDGHAWVCESSCADRICMSSAKIASEGQSILCAPAGVLLCVRGGDNDVDFVAG